MENALRGNNENGEGGLPKLRFKLNAVEFYSRPRPGHATAERAEVLADKPIASLN